ncbi:MAG: hypothetical protein WDM79_11235 [Terricaulis sp.]
MTLLALPVGAALAQQDDPWSHVMNMETAGFWAVMPERPRVQVVDVQGQAFAQAFRVRGRRGANPWDVQANSPSGGDIHRGDTVMVMVFARAEQAAEGGSTMPMRLQLSGAPYSSVFDASFQLTDQWKQYCGSGVATQDFGDGVTNVSLQLATGEQVIDLGPVFVFNFGQNFDSANLPHCPD